jgi:hypothetical protein
MRSNRGRIAVLAAVVAVAVALFVVLRSDEEESPAPAPTTRQTTTPKIKSPKPQTETITVRGGKPVGGVRELSFESGERVRFVVRSDVADEVHVHGYDLTKDVEAGGSVKFNFKAKLEGVFEVELESRKEPIAELKVRPS